MALPPGSNYTAWWRNTEEQPTSFRWKRFSFSAVRKCIQMNTDCVTFWQSEKFPIDQRSPGIYAQCKLRRGGFESCWVICALFLRRVWTQWPLRLFSFGFPSSSILSQSTSSKTRLLASQEVGPWLARHLIYHYWICPCFDTQAKYGVGGEERLLGL